MKLAFLFGALCLITHASLFARQEISASATPKSTITSFVNNYIKVDVSKNQILPFSDWADKERSAYRKAVFIELIGNGIRYSLNYDVRLKKDQNDGLGFRVGLGKGEKIADSGSSYNTLPLIINYIIGAKRSGLEFGAGVTPYFTFKPTVQDNLNVVGFFNLGYRYQPMANGPMFRVTYTPTVENSPVNPHLGVSIGYSFK